MHRKTVLDCFAGVGGLSLGAELAGMEVIGGIDANPDATASYALNFPGKHALKHDLLVEKPRSVLKKVGISHGDVDVLVGGPPCQPYSVNNHQRGTGDVRCQLVDAYLEFVSVLKPHWLLIENVPGFASIEKGVFLKAFLRSLRARGYSADFRIFDATAFGVPQRRRRLVILACRERSMLSHAFNSLASVTSKVVTVSDAIGDLPHEPAHRALYTDFPKTAFQKLMRSKAPSHIQDHIAAGLGSVNLRRIGHVPAGGNWRDIPRHLLPPGMKRARLSDHTTRYGRLHRERPAYTLLTKCDPHWGCFIHPDKNRVITVREAARLQSIPDRVRFTDSIISNYRLIGNAVPPLLGRGILEHLI